MASIDLYADFNEELDARADDNVDEFGRNPDDSEDGNENGGDGGENKEVVDPKLKIVRIKRKIPTLNVERLKGNRGIVAVDDFFKDIKFKGSGYEKQDLNEVMSRLEHWAHRMFPKYNFDDSLAAIERLGKKKEVQVHMTRYRLDQLTKDDDRILSDDDAAEKQGESQMNMDEPMDEFEAMIDEQIALTTNRSNFRGHENSYGNVSSVSAASLFNDLVASQPSSSQQQETRSQVEISDEIRARIAENKRRAMEILAQRRKEADEKLRQAVLVEKQGPQEISNINFDDDDDF